MAGFDSKNIQVAIITGANTGIGRATVTELAKQYHLAHPLIIYLAARTPEKGKQAAAEAREELYNQKNDKVDVRFLHLDVTQDETITAAVETVKHDVGHVDWLINNAGIVVKGDNLEEGPKIDGGIARATAETNYFGVLKVATAFLPLMRENGRIVNVSSILGALRTVSKELQEKFSDPKLTLAKLDGLMEQFISDVEDGTYASKGWPNRSYPAYSVSKVAVTALTRVLGRSPEVQEKDLFVASCCPGWIRTNLAGPNATGTPEEGAQTPVWLLLENKENLTQNGSLQNGWFYKDKQAREW
ncbi:NADH-cytochrome b5 reductase [Gaertneriomyces sp. JEL0708]|nr:NADH-cytochrome b5 reductase [Gaertneriomyces sp. JEL0708]